MDIASKTIGELLPAEIRELVRSKYSEVAQSPNAGYRFRVGNQYAVDLGYPPSLLENIPAESTGCFTGVSSYLARYNAFKPGEIVLELGSGGGLDAALVARKVSPHGKVLGLDLSFAMAQRAAKGSKTINGASVHPCQALAEEIPLADDSVDWVVSNGILNLSSEKHRILDEIHRVLRPDGRVLASEIVLAQEPSPEERLHQEDWFT